MLRPFSRMCGRYVLLRPDLKELMKKLRLEELYNLITTDSRYNIAPSQPVAAFRNASGAGGVSDKQIEMTTFSWGWRAASTDTPGKSVFLVNARGETLTQRPAFKDAFRERRCVLPASGFYEWNRSGKTPEPHFIHLRDNEPFFLAGIWREEEGKPDSCVVITTQPNAIMQKIHDRMPVLFTADSALEWIASRSDEITTIKSLIVPFPAEKMESRPVSTYVNTAKNEGEACLNPPAAKPPALAGTEQLGFDF